MVTRHHELVHEDHPRAHLETAGRGQRAQTRFGLGPHREVVVDHRGLAVEEEPGERRVAFEEIEEVVDQVHELHPVALERRIPLAVPVGVGDDAHPLRHWSSLPSTGYIGLGSWRRSRVERRVVATSARPWACASCAGSTR